MKHSSPAKDYASVAPCFRQVILARLEELERKRAWLVQQLDGHPSRSHVYMYLDAKRDMNSSDIERIAGLLGLHLVAGKAPADVPRKPATPPKMPVK